MLTSILRNRALYLCSLAAAAAGALVFALAPWESVGAPLFIGLLAGGLALGLVLLDSPAEERRFVVRLFLVALGVRLLAAALFHWVIGGNGEYIYSDATTYDRVAWALAQSWRFPGAAPEGLGAAAFLADDIYPRLLAGLYFLLGHANAAAIVINTIFGASSVYLVYRIAAMLFGPVTARWAGWLTAFYTGFWLWEMMTMKDALSLFLILLFFLGLYRVWQTVILPDRNPAQWAGAAGWTAVMIAIFFAAGVLREYVPVILAGAVVLLPLAEFLKSGKFWRWGLVIGVAVLLLILFWPRISNCPLYNIPVTAESTLFQIVEVPDTSTVGALTAWIGTHPAGFLRYLGLTIFSTALAPYAWLLPGTLPEVARFETYMIAFPGMWLWYLVLPFSILGIRESVRRTSGSAWPLIFYAAAIFLVVSILIPREYRHRDMVMPFALMLAAEGLVFSRRWWLAGLIVWIPLIGFIAWKLNSILPLLLLVLAAVAAGILWHFRMRRRREGKMVRLV